MSRYLWHQRLLPEQLQGALSYQKGDPMTGQHLIADRLMAAGLQMIGRWRYASVLCLSMLHVRHPASFRLMTNLTMP